MQNILEYILFLSFSYFFRLCGLNISRKFSSPLSFMVFYIIPIRKKVVLENLKKAFPHLDEKKITEVALNCYKNFIISFIEIMCLPSLSKEEIINILPVKNADLIKRKYDEGKGVILLSAHFGNWEYIAASVSTRINIPFHVVVKPQRNPFVNDWMNKVRTKWINKIIPLGITIRQVYKELKNKNIVAMVADQRGPYEGIRVNFFGMKTAAYSGPAMLAVKTESPIIYGLTIRQLDYSYKVILEEINLSNLPEDEEEKIIEITQRHTSFLEKFILQYPEQWFWMHKRWKY
ncbi:MAG TPA: lysophospholipid acyltransferase family protein [Ignavibacteriaceae bacterium]|nr:lysophospholipid acyltransferase family protein [Ignavibacteriaceae bacterium]